MTADAIKRLERERDEARANKRHWESEYAALCSRMMWLASDEAVEAVDNALLVAATSTDGPMAGGEMARAALAVVREKVGGE